MTVYPASGRCTAPPAPLAPPPGRCKFAELVGLVAPSQVRHRNVPPCTEPATRRVQVGLAASADVCLWHSLAAQGRLNAFLIRDLVAFPRTR